MILRWMGWLLLGLLLLAAAAVYVGARSYRLFTQEEPVAVVRCERAPAGATYGFLIQVTPVPAGRPEKFPMVGDQWAVGGEFLKWSPALAFMGLPPRHKLTRLNSRYWIAADELARPRAAYDLNGGTSAPWRWLHRYGLRVPGVDTVYGTSVYVPVKIGGEWEVFVTHNGYGVRPSKGAR